MNDFDTVIASDDQPHEEVLYSFVTSKGWMTNTPTLFGIAHTKSLKAPPDLPEVDETFVLNGRMLPSDLLSQAHNFFRTIWKRQKTESSLYILWHPQEKEFKLWAPEQYVTHTSVNHKLEVLEVPWQAIGTIHSHCDFSAFHSSTDKHDMDGMSGLHITIGHVDKETPEYALALSVGKASFTVEYDAIIEDTGKSDYFPTHWLQYVKKGSAPWVKGTTTTYKKTAKPTIVPTWGKPSRDNIHNWFYNDDDWYKPSTDVTWDDPISGPPNLLDLHNDDFELLEADMKQYKEHFAKLGFRFEYELSYDMSTDQQGIFDNAPTP